MWLGNTYYSFQDSSNMLNVKSIDLTLRNIVLLAKQWNMLIKFSKQIANTFVKIVNGNKGQFKTLSNV